MTPDKLRAAIFAAVRGVVWWLFVGVNLLTLTRALGDVLLWHYGRAWHKASGLLIFEACAVAYGFGMNYFTRWAGVRVGRYMAMWRQHREG